MPATIGDTSDDQFLAKVLNHVWAFATNISPIPRFSPENCIMIGKELAQHDQLTLLQTFIRSQDRLLASRSWVDAILLTASKYCRRRIVRFLIDQLQKMGWPSAPLSFWKCTSIKLLRNAIGTGDAELTAYLLNRREFLAFNEQSIPLYAMYMVDIPTMEVILQFGYQRLFSENLGIWCQTRGAWALLDQLIREGYSIRSLRLSPKWFSGMVHCLSDPHQLAYLMEKVGEVLNHDGLKQRAFRWHCNLGENPRRFYYLYDDYSFSPKIRSTLGKLRSVIEFYLTSSKAQEFAPVHRQHLQYLSTSLSEALRYSVVKTSFFSKCSDAARFLFDFVINRDSYNGFWDYYGGWREKIYLQICFHLNRWRQFISGLKKPPKPHPNYTILL